MKEDNSCTLFKMSYLEGMKIIEQMERNYEEIEKEKRSLIKMQNEVKGKCCGNVKVDGNTFIGGILNGKLPRTESIVGDGKINVQGSCCTSPNLYDGSVLTPSLETSPVFPINWQQSTITGKLMKSDEKDLIEIVKRQLTIIESLLKIQGETK